MTAGEREISAPDKSLSEAEKGVSEVENDNCPAHEIPGRPRKHLPLLGGEGWGEDGRSNQIVLWFTPALILAFSPGEKEQVADVSVFADGCPANPARDISGGPRKHLPLLGGEGRGEDGRSNQIVLWFTPALILAFSPGQQEQTARDSILRTASVLWGGEKSKSKKPRCFSLVAILIVLAMAQLMLFVIKIY